MTGKRLTQGPLPALESLEDRLALTAYLDHNLDLIIVGTDGPDRVDVHGFFAWSGGPYIVRVIENGQSSDWQVPGGDIGFWGLGGNDYINNWVGHLTLWAWGGRGDDILIGDAGNDHLWGEEGTDWLYGYGGNDVLDGGAGGDLMWGHEGGDWLDGGIDFGASDYMVGGSGGDTFVSRFSHGWDYWDDYYASYTGDLAYWRNDRVVYY